MEKEHKELLAEQLCERVGEILVEQLTEQDPIKVRSATLAVALAYVRYNGVSDNPHRKDSPVKSVEEALQRRQLPPFSSVDEELTT